MRLFKSAREKRRTGLSVLQEFIPPGLFTRFGRSNLVQRTDVCQRRRFQGISAHSQTMEGLLAVSQRDVNFSLSVLAGRNAADLVILLGSLDSGQIAQHLEQRINRAVAGGDSDSRRLFPELQFYRS